MITTEDRLARLEFLLSEHNADIAALSLMLRAFIVMSPDRAKLRAVFQALAADHENVLRECGFEAGYDPEQVGQLAEKVLDRLNTWSDQLDFD